MEYFRLIMDTSNEIQITGISEPGYKHLMNRTNYEAIPEKATAIYELTEDMEIPALLTFPIFLCNKELRHIMDVYDPTIRWKNLILHPEYASQMSGNILDYYLPDFFRLTCMHRDSVILPNGAVEHLILDRDKLRNLDIFQVQNEVENYVIVSLALAESICRRNLYGIGFERVEVR